jgi:hypothetical protein
MTSKFIGTGGCEFGQLETIYVDDVVSALSKDELLPLLASFASLKLKIISKHFLNHFWIVIVPIKSELTTQAHS